jgi:hypothetical protein
MLVSHAGEAAGFPFLPVDVTDVAPVAEKLFSGLSPECSRLLIARTGDTLVGWVHLHRNPSPVGRNSIVSVYMATCVIAAGNFAD